MTKRKSISRRGFVVGGLTSAAIVAGACMCTKTGRATITGIGSTQAIAFDAYDVEDNIVKIQLNKAPALMRIGGALKILDERIDDSLIIVQEAKDVFIAVSIKCTHRGVEVEYEPKEQCFKCASLGSSKFESSGKKIKGFARKPLKTYSTELKKDFLIIYLS